MRPDEMRSGAAANGIATVPRAACWLSRSSTNAPAGELQDDILERHAGIKDGDRDARTGGGLNVPGALHVDQRQVPLRLR